MQFLVGKTGRGDEKGWLPLWMHLRDTAGIMKKLIASWVPESVFTAADMEHETFCAAAVFLAAVHDIGKATSYFQSVITVSCPEKRKEMQGKGYAICNRNRTEDKKITAHAAMGQWILQNGIPEVALSEDYAAVVGAHHGKPCDSVGRIGSYPVNLFGVEKGEDAKDLWRNAWRAITDQAMMLAEIQDMKELPELSLQAQTLLSGLLIVADWIASNVKYFRLLSLEEESDESLYPKRVKDAWDMLNFPKIWSSDTYRMDDEMFSQRFGRGRNSFLPNEVQKCMLAVAGNCQNPGIFILEAQMGIGKTEAALGAAEILANHRQQGGIFFGLPTQATSNGLFLRLYAWAQHVSAETANAIQLAHSAAELQEDYHQLILQGKSFLDEEEEDERQGISVHPWFQGSKRALLADFVIGTVDQFLLASLKRKHFMLRHLGLAGKVVIIDECHAYDAYMNCYLERSLEWMAAYGVPVILLSATLPADRREALINCYVKAYSRYHLKKGKHEVTCKNTDWETKESYPLLTWSNGECIVQEEIQQNVPEKTIRIGHISSSSDLILQLKERLQDGGCACVIVNTVKAAQKLYHECSGALKNITVELYHAQFSMPDRLKKEQELLRRMGKDSDDTSRKGYLLIGTQVLEQSLDYDTDFMVTQLCPVDLFLQRLGRLHRHPRNGAGDVSTRPLRLREPECLILQEEDRLYDDGTGEIYTDYLLLRTNRVLTGEVKLPTDIPRLVQKVYNKNLDLGLGGEAYKKACETYENVLKEKAVHADRYRIGKPASMMRFNDLLFNPEESEERVAEASVRDGASPMEVLLMKRNKDGDIVFATDDYLDKLPVSPLREPDSETARLIAMQRLKLPHLFSVSWEISSTIRELENRNRKELSQWQRSPWLHGELILLLDQDNCTELNGYLLSYSFEKGLECVRKEKANGR